MQKSTTRRLSFWFGALSLVSLAAVTACTTDDSDPDSEDTGGSGGASTGGASTGGSNNGGSTSGTGGGATGGSSTGGTGTGGGGTTGTACAFPRTLMSSTPAIADFDDYDGSADLAVWSFPLGGDSATMIYAGTFGYGDDAGGKPETFAMIDGHDSTYSLSISDTLSSDYGGGMGLWISDCLNATAFSGISLWVRGTTPEMTAKISLMMEETTSDTANMPMEKIGTCPGTDDECIHPSNTFPVTADWTEIRIPWAGFTGGMAATTPVAADGHNIWQIQFDVGLHWAANEAGEYVPMPSGYEFEVDDIAFY